MSNGGRILEKGGSPGPADDDHERGRRFALWVSPGTIYGQPDVVLWRYRIRPKRFGRLPFVPSSKPEFVLSDPAGEEVLRIKRGRGFVPSFEMIEGGAIVGRVIYGSILRTKCTLEFAGEPGWAIRQPLFTVFFAGVSTEGRRAWIRVGPSKRQWNILTQPGADSMHLLSALALLHWEYWTH